MMTLLQSFILALIQGLTEFLPVSSSGHLVILPKLMHFEDPGLAFDAFLHLGTLLAALIYFRKDITDIVINLRWRLMLGIILATLPAAVLGLSFKDFFESEFVRSLDFVAWTLIAGSILIYVSEKFFQGKKSFKELSVLEIFFIGVMQALALLPGMSRSGSTISAGLFMGLKKAESARFAFIVGLPAVAGAGLLTIKDLFEMGSSGLVEFDTQVLLLGFLVSFASGYAAIGFLIWLLKKYSLLPFVVYRLILTFTLINF